MPLGQRINFIFHLYIIRTQWFIGMVHHIAFNVRSQSQSNLHNPKANKEDGLETTFVNTHKCPTSGCYHDKKGENVVKF